MKKQVDNPKTPYFVGKTGNFIPEKEIYDDGEFIIMDGQWVVSKRDEPLETDFCTCVRWYSGDSIGYPNAFGRAQWMVLPDKIAQGIKTMLMMEEFVSIKQ